MSNNVYVSHLSQRARVLVASSCASMGADVGDVRVVVNVGKPSSDWILSQQMGRAGRDGEQSASINLARAVRTPGETNPASTVGLHIYSAGAEDPLAGNVEVSSKAMSKEIMAVYDGKKCSRIGMNSLFSVKDAYRKLETVYS